MSAEYPYAQWFDAPPPCRICGKPAGVLRSCYGNANLAYMCRLHAEKAIKAAHKRGRYHPDAVLAAQEDSQVAP